MAYSACLVPPGSENMANDHEGSPGTWETLPSPSKCRPETRLTNSRWIHGPVSWAVGDERGTQRWYRQAKETKCGERDVRESQRLIVPSSRGNHPEGPRGGKEAPSQEPLEGNMIGTPRPATVFTKQQRIAELARNGPEMAFTTLAHHIDINWMHMAYAQTRKDGAVGVDGQTAADYENNLMGNLQDLLDRAKSGTYVAPPVRRVHIPKAGSPNETRPLGIPTFEDKILQRAVLMVLEPVYETDFLDASHGFRPGRGAHGALDSLWKQAMNLGCCWIVDVDLRKFFDTIDHGHLREFLKRRVRDGVILRLIGKWLNAGVLEDGVLTTPEHGTPQGGVVTPPTMLQNCETVATLPGDLGLIPIAEALKSATSRTGGKSNVIARGPEPCSPGISRARSRIGPGYLATVSNLTIFTIRTIRAALRETRR